MAAIPIRKITDQGYFLPLVEALNGLRVLSSGTTQPMLISGICTTTHSKSEYVVKYHKAPRMSVEASCRELVASFIAMQLGLQVAEPAIIRVSSVFVDTLTGMDGYKAAANSIGLNFGCKYVPGYMEFIWKQELNALQYEQAQEIFAFDTLISNADRRSDKQNMLTNGEDILIFDHELAFGFVLDLIKNPTPWIFSPADKVWIKNHFFYATLKENTQDFTKFVNKYDILGEQFWDKVDQLIPAEWKTRQVDEIRHNLSALVSNKEIFLEELYKVLS